MAFRVLWRNLADLATVTASSSTYGNAAGNVQHPHTYTVWQTDVLTAEEWLEFDFGEATTINCFVALEHDLSTLDTGIILEGTDDTSSGAVWTPIVSPTWRLTALVEFFNSVTYRLVRFRFTKQTAGDQRVLGRVFLGTYFEPERQPSGDGGGLEITPVDQSVTWRSPHGPTWTDIRGQYQRVEATFRAMPQADADTWASIGATVGEHDQIFISGDHANYPVDWLWYGKLVELVAAKFRANSEGGAKVWDGKLTLETEP